MALLSARTLFSYEHRLLGLMLICLIGAITLIDDVPVSKSLLVAHFGFFLLWQPILAQHESVSISRTVVLLVFLCGFIIWFNLWTAAAWILLLMSMLTGRIFARGLSRAIYGLSVVILFLEMTLILTPNMFEISTHLAKASADINHVLLLLSFILLLFPSAKKFTTHVDFIRGFMVVILTLFLCMGSVLVTYRTGNDYISSLAATILIAAGFLFATAILWTPRAGFAGLAQLWEKYLLNIGGPFEQWVTQLAALEANTNVSPDGFLETCVRYLVERHWISGIYWKSSQIDKLEGEKSNHHVTYSDTSVRITLYAHNPIGPALLLHSRLLLSVLTFYYRAKLQEQQLIKQAHLRAIYETGSKLTHDIKNILQSTQMLTTVISDRDTPVEDARTMLSSQLPLLAQRLRTTLDKLAAPAPDDAEMTEVRAWWDQMRARYTGRDINFVDAINTDIMIPAEVFDTTIENLLDNARTKRIDQPGIEITVTLAVVDEPKLTVRDSGKPIPDEVRVSLFREVIRSENGFGIGLYQTGQVAKKHGYTLSLRQNTDDGVVFELSQDTSG